MDELNLEVKQVIQRTHNVKSIRLGLEETEGFKPGQFLQATIQTQQGPMRRYLSISNSPTEQDYIEFTKKITQSVFSKSLDKLNPQDTVAIKYPFGVFTFEGEHKKVVFLPGGIGITPIRSMVKYAVDKKLDTDMVLIRANRSIKDIAFKHDFEAMAKEHPKLRIVDVLSQPEQEWQGRTGYINAEIIKQEVPDFTQRKFYVCGPPVMVEAMIKILLEQLGLSKQNVLFENFKGY